MTKATSTSKKDATASTGAAATPNPPRFILLGAGALVLSAVASVGAAAALFGAKDFLLKSATTANNKLKVTDKNHKTAAEVMKAVDSTPKGVLLQAVIVAAVLVFLAVSARRGKYWSRWAIIGIWVLASFTGVLPGFTTTILGVGLSVPVAYKVPAFIAGLAIIAAVVLVTLKPSVAYLNHNRPVRPGRPGRPAGAARGLFASRASVMANVAATKADTRSAGKPDPAAATRTSTGPDRSRSKVRASSDSVAKGADLARSRAKAASKSRRTGS